MTAGLYVKTGGITTQSRRVTSFPMVGPTIRPTGVTTRTTSGSGLFQVGRGSIPTSSPVPTADIGWALVKISASGPMHTSMGKIHWRAGGAAPTMCA
jgi:hypothetical protein